MCMYMCISACVCIYVDTYVCMTVLHMYVCIGCAYVHLCMCACVFVCMCACGLHVCAYVYVCVPWKSFQASSSSSGFSLMGISTKRVSLTTLFVWLLLLPSFSPLSFYHKLWLFCLLLCSLALFWQENCLKAELVPILFIAEFLALMIAPQSGH